MNRTDIINDLIDIIGATSYLEIGVYDRTRNFDKIKCDRKVGVDIRTRGRDIITVTSDEFFASTQERFGVIFVDGDHSYEQAARDIANAVRVMERGGAVIVHDVNPERPEQAVPEKPAGGRSWCGEVYRVFSRYRTLKTFIAYAYTCDHGVGIIRRGRNEIPIELPDPLDFAAFEKNRARIFGLV